MGTCLETLIKGIKMKNYVEFTIIKNSEVSPHIIMSKFYNKFHKNYENKNIGVTFPEYIENKTLGSKIRLFSDNIDELESIKNIVGNDDYIHCTKIKNTPEKINEKFYYKKHREKNKQYLIKRFSERHNIGIAESSELYEDFEPKKISTPFVNIKKGNSFFRLFVLKTDKNENSRKKFNSYGLNSISLPHF